MTSEAGRWTWRGMPRSRAGAERRGERQPGAGGLGALDGGVLASSAALAAFGVVMVYSATAPLALDASQPSPHALPLPPHLARHGIAVAGAGIAAAIGLRVPLGVWRRLAFPAWSLCVLLLVAAAVLGVEAKGAQRWIALPGLPFRLQPVEPAKWATLVAVAALLAGAGPRALRTGRILLVAAALCAPPVALLLAQPDLGNTIVLVALVGLVLFAAGARLPHLLVPAAVAAGVAAAAIALRPYALARVRGFLHPWETARAEGFQLVQSFVAFGRGGLTGVGLGDGRQKLFYLPEAHTDFILSVIAEELGLVGVLGVLGAFAAFALAGTRIARRTPDPFARLVAFGMTALVVVPAAVNTGVVMGLLPTTGLALPFVSYGGNSLLVCGLAVGMLLRIGAREGARPPGHAVAPWRRRPGR